MNIFFFISDGMGQYTLGKRVLVDPKRLSVALMKEMCAMVFTFLQGT